MAILSNTITVSPDRRRIYYLGYDSLQKGILYSWKEYLVKLMKEAEWIQAFSVCLQILQGHNRMFSQVPIEVEARRELMEPFTQTMVKEYINY